MKKSDSLGWGVRAVISVASFLVGLFGLLWWQQKQDEQLLNEMEPYQPSGATAPAARQRSSDEDIS